jgi:hypothetical protein
MLERVFIHLFLFFYVFLVQTDMMDLSGSDLPVESDEGMKFSWSDGILLQVEMSCNRSFVFFSTFDVYLTLNYNVCAGLEGRLLGFAG